MKQPILPTILPAILGAIVSTSVAQNNLPDDVRAMVQDTLSAYGRLDCAFNNAGIAPYQVDSSGRKTAEWEEESFDRMIAVNLKGVWLCMKEEIPTTHRRIGGSIHHGDA